MRPPRVFILRLVTLFSVATTALSAPLVYDNGAKVREDGWEMTEYFQADDFQVAQTTRLSEVTFWSFDNPGAFAGTILWEIYTNSAENIPGKLVATGTSGSVNRFPTGITLFMPILEYVNTFAITPVVLQPGTYWLALHNGPAEHVTRGFFWTPSQARLGAASHSRYAPAGDEWFSQDFIGFRSDLAFRLYGTIQPAITGLARNNGIPRIRFNTVVGQTYRVEYKNEIREAEWTPVPGATSIAGTGEEREVDDPDPSVVNRPSRFYRVMPL